MGGALRRLLGEGAVRGLHVGDGRRATLNISKCI